MDSSVLKRRGAGAFAGLLALAIGTGTMQATVLSVTTPVVVTCNTATGPGTAATIVVKASPALVSPATIAVTFAAPGGGLVVTAPGSTTLNAANNTAGLTYVVNTAAGCVGTSTGATVIQFKAGGVNDVTTTVNDTVTASASA